MCIHAYRCIHLCSNMFICVTIAGMDCCVPSHSVSGSRCRAWSGNRVFSFSDYHSDYFVSKVFVCVCVCVCVCVLCVHYHLYTYILLRNTSEEFNILHTRTRKIYREKNFTFTYVHMYVYQGNPI